MIKLHKGKLHDKILLRLQKKIGACGTYEREENCLQSFVWKAQRKETRWKT